MTSKKLSRIPLLHLRLLLRQLMHAGSASSHLRCRSLQVRQPVLTLLDFAGIKAAIGLPTVSMINKVPRWFGNIAPYRLQILLW